MELNIINTHYSIHYSQQFIDEIERVASDSTANNRGTSEVVIQLSNFIRNTCHFVQNLGNLAHSTPYINLGNDLFGYDTLKDDSNFGIGIITFRIIGESTSDTKSIENAHVDYSRYRLLLECREMSKMISLMERMENK